jgi:hypothetical protein
MFAAAVLSAASRMIMFLVVLLTHQAFASVFTDTCVLNKSNYFGPIRWRCSLASGQRSIHICLLKFLVILFLLYVSTWLNFWQKINISCPDQVGKQNYRMFHGKCQDEQLCEKVTAYRWTDMKCTFGRYVLVIEVGYSWPRKEIESIHVSMCNVLWIMRTKQLVSEVKNTTTFFMLVAV